MSYVIKFRRDSSTEWATHNPTLGDGEPGYERDTGKIKVGNGFTAWNDLPYLDHAHVNSLLPHPVYDDGPSLTLLYENAKV